MKIFMNGKLVPKDEAMVSVFDHGLLYGDGVFEGIRIYEGNVFRLREHIERLYESAKTVAIDIPMTLEEMEQATLDTVSANDERNGYIRLVVTRGVGDLGIDPASCPTATVFIICSKIKLYPEKFYEEGISLITASTRRIPVQCLDPRIKSLNYLNNIMAKIEAKKAGVPEAIMLNTSGHVAECTADNIFLIKKGLLRTPSLMEGALPGVTRQSVMDLAPKLGLKVEECRLGLHDLYNAEECFLTGTGAEIVPVIRIDGREIANGRPGRQTHELLAAFRKLRVKDGASVSYA